MVQALIVPLSHSPKSIHALPFARVAARTFGGRLVLPLGTGPRRGLCVD